jgi:putative transposase
MPHIRHIIRHRGVEKEELIKIGYATKRWVVERTNSWHNRFRKLLLVRYEKKSENYLALVCLACCIIIVYRRIVLG